MTDVSITADNKVRFQKKLWDDTEIVLAKCYNFSIDITSVVGIIEADPMFTDKRAMFEFIKFSFKSFSESTVHEHRRNAFYESLSSIYKGLDNAATEMINRFLPYADKLYAHQVESIQQTFYKKHNFLALDMGLGKSLISASISRIHQIPRTVIVCPAAVKWNWFRDLTSKFGFNELYFTILDSSKYRCVKAFNERFVIINYDILEKFSKELCSAPVGHFILDEAHYLKSHHIGRYKSFKKIAEQFPDARITLLSGTPVKNRVNDVFAYLKLIGHELGNNHKKFMDTYTLSTTTRGGSKVSGGKNLNDLYIKMANFMIRKTKEECLDLPGKIYLQYKYELDDYREEYNAVIEDLAKQKTISSLTGNLNSLNIITSKAKKKGIIEIANNIIEQGKKVVIFGGYREPLNDLELHFGNACVKIDGSVPAYERDQRVQRFTNDPECTVFLGNMVAAGVGINLTVASDVIFMNFPFTPAELYQATDRCDRIGQKSCVNVHYTFCDESIDEYIYEIIMDKERDINTLIDRGKEVNLRENITELLIKKLLKREDVEILDDTMDNVETQPEVQTTIQTGQEESVHNGLRSSNGESGDNDKKNSDDGINQHNDGSDNGTKKQNELPVSTVSGNTSIIPAAPDFE